MKFCNASVDWIFCVRAQLSVFQLETSPVQAIHHAACWSFCQIRSRVFLN